MKRLKHKHGIAIVLLKIVGICLLLLFPVQVNSDPATDNSAAANAPVGDLNYWQGMVTKLEAVHALSPSNATINAALANAYNNCGVLYANSKQWSDAANYLQKAIALDPNNDKLKQNLSNVYFEEGYEVYTTHQGGPYTGMHAEAIQLANQAIAADSNNGPAYLLLGDIEYMDQHMPEAQNAWQKAANLMPNNQEVQKRLAQITRETSVETGMNGVFDPYFNIRMDPEVGQNPAFNIVQILDYAHDHVAPDFSYTQADKVPVVVYSHAEYQNALEQAPEWSEAAYDGKIRLSVSPSQNDFKQIQSDVVHEYTHSIVADYTNNNCPRWFNEGIAKYEEFKYGLPQGVYLLAMAYNSNSVLSWSDINNAIVSPDGNTALLAYQQSFSFVYYLIQTYGMGKIVAVLKLLGNKVAFDNAIQQTYNLPLETLQKNWQDWLGNFINNEYIRMDH